MAKFKIRVLFPRCEQNSSMMKLTISLEHKWTWGCIQELKNEASAKFIICNLIPTTHSHTNLPNQKYVAKRPLIKLHCPGFCKLSFNCRNFSMWWRRKGSHVALISTAFWLTPSPRDKNIGENKVQE